MLRTAAFARSGAPFYSLVFAACGGQALTPAVEAITPASGVIGTEVVIAGANFDRDGAGYPLSGGARPWRVYLVSPSRRYELPLLDASATGLRATIPEGAESGRIVIADDGGTIDDGGATFTVLPFPQIRFVNEAQYDLVDLRLNGEQVLVDGTVIESGAAATLAVGGGRYRLEYGLGEPKEPWVRGTIHGVEVAGPGTEAVARIPALGLLDLLSVGGAPTDWVAVLVDAQDNETRYVVRFYGDGSWAHLVDSTVVAEGQLAPPPIEPYANLITFRLADGGEPVRFAPPFRAFDLRNGPPSAPLLRYTRAE